MALLTLPFLFASTVRGPNAVAAGAAWDSSFGCVGTAVTLFDGTGYDSVGLVGVATTPDGGIVAVGSAHDPSGWHIVVVRYLPNGDLDSSFGTGGMSFLSLPSVIANDLAIQADGKILVAGRTSFGDYDALLVRLDASGALDPAFGAGGITEFPIGDDSSALGVALDGAGHPLVAGVTTTAGLNSAFLTRFTFDGALDPSFGSNGVLSFTAGASQAAAGALAVRSDDEVIVGGDAEPASAPAQQMLALVTTSGTLDPTFGGGAGWVRTDAGSPQGGAVRGVAIDAEGRILTAGYATVTAGKTSFRVARYDAGGALDPSFGSDGIEDVATGHDAEANGIVALADGSIYVWGTSDVRRSPWHVSASVARLLPDGSPDPIFGDAGVRSTDLHDSTWVYDGTIDTAGRVVLVAQGYNGPVNGILRLDPSMPGRHCPDGLIEKPGGSYQGDDVYGSAGAGGNVSVRIRPGHSVTITMQGQNDGNAPAPVLVTTRLWTGRFEVTYRSEGANITNWLHSEWEVWLDPGEAVTFSMKVTVPATVQSGTDWHKVLRISSFYTPAVADEVALALHVR
jgi:uncharacterized delta-60 repeat protein